MTVEEDQTKEDPEFQEAPDVKDEDSIAVTASEESSENGDTFKDSVRDISYHPGQIVLYNRPKQRQKWGDTQILPRVNWGDTFYDLFFVAAAYNVGNILLNAPSGRGMLYFVGCFFPVMSLWRDKMFYDARFVVDDDLWHRALETVFFMIAASGILFISTEDVMSNPRENVDMFAFALVLAVFTFCNFVGYGEIYFMGVGQPQVLKWTVLRDIKFRILPFMFQLTAATIAGVEYFVHGEGASNAEKDAGSYTEGSSYGNSTYQDGDDHRMLAGDEYETKPYQNDLPIWFCLASVLAIKVHLIVSVQFLFPKDGSHKKFTIPMNVAFVIHRDGEWIMLMLGESILSLLIVDVTEGQNYYITFFCGIITVVLLQYLHYRSQPHDANLHAMRRDKDAGIWWSITNQLYSAALICVGVSYKHFLFDFTFEARRLEELEAFDYERVLAGGGGLEALPTEVRQQAAANLFSGAVAIVFFCLDAMSLLHRGLKDSMGRCHCSKTKKKNTKGIFLTVARIGLIVFFATLSQYENDPQHLAIYGLVGVVAQLIIRRLGFIFFVEQEKQEEAEGLGRAALERVDQEENKWPNVTHAAVDKPEKDQAEYPEKEEIGSD